jgi:Arc/MetJ-type ribon-helix-helix transcriptional regulator
VARKPRVVTFRMDQATWDWMRELVPYTRYRTTSSFIREGIDLLLKREEEQPTDGPSAGREGGDGICPGAGSGRRPSPVADGRRASPSDF